MKSESPEAASDSLTARLSLAWRQQIYKVMISQNYFVCSAPSRILVYSINTKKISSIKVSTPEFKVVSFPPWIFACFISQFMYLYNEEALEDVTKIVKMKISKLNVMAICAFNKGYFMAGANRSRLPGGNTVDRRSIYFLENLTAKQKNRPLWEIELPKSHVPVTMLEIQNPYLMCYCEPNIYIINPFNKEILLSFQKEFEMLSLLQGRYALNCINMLGVSLRDKTIISVDVERFPIYGVELNQYKEKANSVCQSREGNIYACFDNLIFSYNLFKKEKKIVKEYEPSKEVLQLACSAKNILIALIKSSEQEEVREDEQDESGLVLGIEQNERDQETTKSLNMGQKYEKFSHEIIINKSTSLQINHHLIQRRYIDIFML